MIKGVVRAAKIASKKLDKEKKERNPYSIGASVWQQSPATVRQTVFWSALSNAESIHGTRVRNVRGCGKPLSSLRVGGCEEPLVLPSPGRGGPPSVREQRACGFGRPYISAACAVVSHYTELVRWACGVLCHILRHRRSLSTYIVIVVIVEVIVGVVAH
ncbi:retrovirus-related pol polyprotein [Plakobranchus ocellatus]|uniref:Retrovirus-related pol polyprotein n=1 Tax=Plakobranchus ocellatus TaxID=259542 RepID=A0AAV4CGT8_9GAST|nr:retrovirus-related pol polyprotein [Plakobranchus ocellatus]